MTAQPKSVIKSYFVTGAKPTQAQFSDLVDSYQDSSAALTALASAGTGVTGLSVLSTNTPASARTAIGLTTSVSGGNYINPIITIASTGIIIAAANGSSSGTNAQTFTSSGTWTKPSSGTVALIRGWGAGGSGGRDSGGGGGGGGGGEYLERYILLSSLGATETVTIGNGGAGVATDNNGNSGSNTIFGSWLTAYGGGAGGGNTSNFDGGGGGAGSTGTGNNASGGTPGATKAIGGGAGGNVRASGSDAGTIYGGGGGSGGAGGGDVLVGGNSVYGGAGGGGGTNGGGISTGGNSVYGGNGGVGAQGGGGGAGSVPAGGGGGCQTGTSGAGGNGRIEVYVW